MSVDVSESPLLITAGKVAEMLGMSTRSVWRLLSAGQLPKPVRIGGAVRWRIDEIKNWIAGGCQMSTGLQ